MNYLFIIEVDIGNSHHYVIRVPLCRAADFEKLDYEEVLFPGGVEIMLTEVSHICGIPVTKLELPCHVDKVEVVVTF